MLVCFLRLEFLRVEVVVFRKQADIINTCEYLAGEQSIRATAQQLKELAPLREELKRELPSLWQSCGIVVLVDVFACRHLCPSGPDTPVAARAGDTDCSLCIDVGRLTDFARSGSS